ncbi:MAG: hypothetical protein U5J98_12030 [Halobacteriales archaeon]|nr:hypothetical protein [Halobacteriales archaeon]
MIFRDQLQRGHLGVDAAREFAIAEYDLDEEAIGDKDLEEALRDQYDLPDRLTDPGAEAVLAEAQEHILEEDQPAAAELLATEFASPCEETHPDLLDIDSGRLSACLRTEAGISPSVPSAWASEVDVTASED